ncbi:DUF4192 domain-containing protein [uncultured Friedmanniella sp.]|uniref:DUF4192 domain-containing protein n=1 Tax=uncultured Friedmanniella sp. TaxID=335381 RepID=UPI0035CB799E
MRRPDPRPAAPTRLRVRRPADFLALIPYLLGFHPEESVVVIFSARGRVLLTARMDLPPPCLADSLAEQLVGLGAQHDADELVLAGYGKEDADARLVLERLARQVTVPVRESLLVSGGRWWSLTCSSGCCPAEGTPYDPGSHPLAAEAVYAGMSVQPGRGQLQRQVGGPGQAEEARLADRAVVVATQVEALGREERAALMAETVQHCCADAQGPDEDEGLLLAVLAADLVVRDVAWSMVTRDEVEDHLRVWARTVATAPASLALGPLGLLGVTAWIAGQGALQNCCAERMQQLDPQYTLAAVLDDISDRALPPRYWDELAESLRQEVGAVAGLPGVQ